ncbi:MAG: DUF4388 domain-containing protein [Deltaproteobacteria bacterium]|nr:DUF4388 domain-containing protein [Deltaproteobacteria bacterium]
MSSPQALNQRIADRLLADGRITQEEHRRAVGHAEVADMRVEEALLSIGILTEEKLLKYVATVHGTQFVSTDSLSKARVDPRLLKLVPKKVAEMYRVVPLVFDARAARLVVATPDPDDLAALDEVRLAAGVRQVRPLVARPAAVSAAIARAYLGDKGAFAKLLRSKVSDIADLLADDPFLERDREAAEEAPAAGGATFRGDMPSSPPSGIDAPRPAAEGARATPPAPAGARARAPAPAPVAAPEPEPARPAGKTDPGMGFALAGDELAAQEELAPAAAAAAVAPAVPAPPRVDAPPLDLDPDVSLGAVKLGLGGAVQEAPRGSSAFGGKAARRPAASPAPPAQDDEDRAGTLPRQVRPPTLVPFFMRPEPPPAEPAAGSGDDRCLETLRVLVSVIENERRELRGHSALVARLVAATCERMGMAPAQARPLVMAGYLHDLGKMGHHHLTALNVADFESHTVAARKLAGLPQQLMSSVGLPEQTQAALCRMYERVDGKGFPAGMPGKEIPLGARLLAVADAYADLTQNSRNAYRKTMRPEEALDVIEDRAGTIFDANVVQLLREAITGEKIVTDLLADRTAVLLVDPDPEDTMVLHLRLAEQGFLVQIASSADEARKALEARRFAMVVSEVDLDKADAGLHLRAEVALSGRDSEACWVFYSSRTGRRTAQRAFDLDADDYVAKTTPVEVLVAKLMQLLEKKAAAIAPRGVSGSLSEMGLPDIVQVLWHGRKTCALHVKSGECNGEVHFKEGQIVDAVCGDATGEVAFYRLLVLRDKGSFQVDPEFVPRRKRIDASPEALLLEGMRLIDENAVP